MTEEQSGLVGALAASSQQRAVYNDGQTRAFVSQRGSERYDLGVRSLVNPAQRTTKFDEPAETLHTVLKSFGVPEDAGWLPQGKA